MLFVWLAATTAIYADGTKHYLAFASDRHNNVSATGGIPVVNTAMGVWKDLPVEYVSLIGDMVGSGNEAPPYDVSEVWTEVHSLFPDLPLDQFSIIWGSHDAGYTDSQNLGIMKLPSTSKNDYGGKSTHIYTAPDQSYYIYAINHYEMLNTTIAEPEAFKQWVDGIDKRAVIIVLCHVPLHYLRKDNLNAANWTDALNYAATGSVNGTEVTRNVVYLFGHNHSQEPTEYNYKPGDVVAVQGQNGSVNKTIQFSYITPGYLKMPSGVNTVNASLMTIDDEEIVFTKSKSGTTSLLATVERVAADDATYYDVTFESNGGSEVAPQRVKEGNNVTEPSAPTRKGYEFVGWFSDETLTTAYDFSQPVTEPFTLYAKWTEKEMTVLTYYYAGTSTVGDAYVIVSNGYALVNNNGNVGSVAVSVVDDVVTIKDYDIDESKMLWTVGADGSLKNGSYYVRRASGSSEQPLTLSTSLGTKYTNWIYTGDQLNVLGGSSGTTNHYIYYKDGWKVNSTTNYTAKLYSKDKSPVVSVCATPELTYAGGQVTCTCATEGVTYKYEVALSNATGESTNGVITIGPAVTVTVRASKEGMLDSEPAALMFNLSQVGDVNCDGDISIADVTELVNIILGR